MEIEQTYIDKSQLMARIELLIELYENEKKDNSISILDQCSLDGSIEALQTLIKCFSPPYPHLDELVNIEKEKE